MKIAIPITETNEFSPHYGAAIALACFEADDTTRILQIASVLQPAAGTPCSWPDLLNSEGVTVMLVGGMGTGARARCELLGIEVIAGVPASSPAEMAVAYLAGTLQPGESACGDGGHHHHHQDHHHDHAHQHAGEGHCNCAH